MALSLSNFLVTLLMLLPNGLITLTDAATINYDWNVEWLTANPDGLAERPVIGINGQWPLPLINVTKGDHIIVNLHNKVRVLRESAHVCEANTRQLGNESTSMHWHGLFQRGTTDMDGSGGVNQCDIPPGSSMTYNFTVRLTFCLVDQTLC